VTGVVEMIRTCLEGPLPDRGSALKLARAFPS
jgi:hypothetical protein